MKQLLYCTTAALVFAACGKTETKEVIVSPPDTNQPARFIDASLTGDKGFTVAEGESLEVKLQVFNPEDEVVTLELQTTDIPDLRLEPERQAIVFEPSFAAEGTYKVIISVTDGVQEEPGFTVIDIEVTDTNLPVAFKPPSTKSFDFTLGQPVTIPIELNNPDGDATTVTAKLDEEEIPVEFDGTGITLVNPPQSPGEFQLTVSATDAKQDEPSAETFTINFFGFVKFLAGQQTSFRETSGSPVSIFIPIENPFAVKDWEARITEGQVAAINRSPDAIELLLSGDQVGKQRIVVEAQAPGQSEPESLEILVTIGGVNYLVYADPFGSGTPFDSPWGTAYSPFVSTDVVDAPYASFLSQNMTEVWNGPTLRQDPWIFPDTQMTAGNSVIAYLDLGGALGYQEEFDLIATMTAPGEFAYPYDSSQPPQAEQNRNAAVVNLFYVINYLHDWFYDFGFDEQSGNAQQSNFGRGGLENDPLLAEGQDFSGRNNANMSTPSDGRSPVMQMYLFDNFIGDLSVKIGDQAPAKIQFGAADFGSAFFDLIEQEAAFVTDETGNGEACTPITNPESIQGKIALINRGECTFVEKTLAAEAAGAQAVIIINNTADGANTLSGGGSPDAEAIGIPVMSMTQADGDQLKSLPTETVIAFSMFSKRENDLDGTMENTIIAHEWGHYITNRLIGDGTGLYNNQGRSMGEGWGDFMGLMLVVKPEDALVPGNEKFQGTYSMGAFAVLDNFFGIRRAPYTTDMSVNPLTFKHIEQDVPLPPGNYRFGQDGSGNARVHASGEIWGNMLWEVYAGLLNDPRYTFKQAQDRMAQLFVDSLKLTPVQPTYVEARNAVLAAASNNAEDYKVVAAAFSKRGMGPNAVAPDKADNEHRGVVEDFSPFPPLAN